MGNTSGKVAATLGYLTLLVAAGCGGTTEPGPLPDAGTPIQGDSGVEPQSQCGITFVAPMEGDELTVSDDNDGDCSNGFTVDVSLELEVTAGTQATARLQVNRTDILTLEVPNDGTLTFEDVPVDANSVSDLRVVLETEDDECEEDLTVTTTCDGPTCFVSAPVVSAAKPKLNGVPATDGGDRVSLPGAPYQAAFTVTTDIEDGLPVFLNLGGPVSLAAVVQDGKAEFPGALVGDGTDGEYDVVAVCENSGEISTTSQTATYVVDTDVPTLTVTPANGTHIGPNSDTNTGLSGLQFQICGVTSSADALNLSAELAAGSDNFVVEASNGEVVAVAATTGGGFDGADGACAEFTCSGPVAKDYTVTLLDDAGNPQTAVIEGITCTSATPDVVIVEPVASVLNDPNTNILAYGQATARTDETLGDTAHYTVVACTNAEAGMAQLFVDDGNAGPYALVASTETFRAAQVADGCPSGFDFVVQFPGARLSQSALLADGSLFNPTRLRVDVTQDQETGDSPPRFTWVHTVPQVTQFQSPVGLCTSDAYQAITAPFTQAVTVLTTQPATVHLSNDTTTTDYEETQEAATPGAPLFDVPFQLGPNVLTASTTTKAGNVVTATCSVQVGPEPFLEFRAFAVGDDAGLGDQSPVAGDLLNSDANNPVADADPGTPGWQGTLRVLTDFDGNPACGSQPGGVCVVSFYADDVLLGTAPIDDVTGEAELDVSIPDQSGTLPVTIRAESTSLEFGPGTDEFETFVDTVVPVGLTLDDVVVVGHRASDFSVVFSPEGDAAQLPHHVIAWRTQPYADCQAEARAAVDAMRADNNSYTLGALVVETGIETSLGSGQYDSVIPGLRIETDYYFAVASSDISGNLSEFSCRNTPARDSFIADQIIVNPAVSAAQGFGAAIDGSRDLVGSAAFADVLVGSFNVQQKAYIYAGSADGLASTPAVTFTDPRAAVTTGFGTHFGTSLTVLNFNGDAYPDIAIGSPYTANYLGDVHVFLGSAQGWPANVAIEDAEVHIVPLSGGGHSALERFGWSLANVGNFDGDAGPQTDDLAIGIPGYTISGYAIGMVAIVRGSSAYVPGQNQVDVAIGVASPAADAGLRGAFATGQAIAVECPTTLCLTSSPPNQYYFGQSVTGAGALGGSAAGLVVSASGRADDFLVAYRGQSAPANNYINVAHSNTAPIAATTPDVRLGMSLASVGLINGARAVVAGAPYPTAPAGTSGTARVYFGDEDGLFATDNATTYSQPDAPAVGDMFGIATMGSYLPSTGQISNILGDSSLFGDEEPTGDVAIAGLAGTARKVFFLDGDELAASRGMSGVDISSAVSLDFPATGFTYGAGWGSKIVGDVDGDGWGDLVITENNNGSDYLLYSASDPNHAYPTVPGVLWVIR